MDNYIISSEYSVEKLKYNSLSELIFNKLSEKCEQSFIIDCSSGQTWSRKQVLDMSLNFAYYLINDCKLSKGDIVLFVMDNTVLHAIGLLGVVLAGGVYFSFPSDAKQYEIEINLLKTKPLVVICFEENYQMIDNCCKELTFIQKVLLIDNNYDKCLHLSQPTVEEICKTQRKQDINLPIVVDLNDIATLLMSSGSTGLPKLVIKSHQNHLSLVESVQHKELYLLTSEDVALCGRLSNSAGQRYMLYAINAGAQLAIIETGFDLDHLFNCIRKYHISHVYLVPAVLNYLIRNYKKFDKGYLKCLSDVMTGSAPLAVSTYNFIVDNYNWKKLRNGFGLTESPRCILVPTNSGDQDYRTVGKVCPNNEVKVIDEMGNSLAANIRGEICVRGAQVTPGYYKNEEQNKKSFTFDGFFKTGDLGYYDDNFYFFIDGRIKECITVEGCKVFPPELEDILMKNPDVIHAAVIGVNDEHYGEVPMAFVTLIEGSTVTVNELLDFFNSKVGYFKQLRGGLKIIDKMPVNSLNKIMKLKLREMI